eukprot:GGOE01057609.1.p1 GENE.GGOE01057609.1~~GGOE01057609.1.p1  ORF type:complete len:170 (-),score=66.51 GGOE01057609.1:197-664(-)
MYKQTTSVLSVQVSNYALHTHRIQQDGRLVPVAGVDGITSLLELSPNLAEQAKDEKALIGMMFEREATRDKNLIQRAREMKQKRKKSDPSLRPDRNIGNVEETELQQITERFWDDVKQEEAHAVQRQDQVKAQREAMLQEIDANPSLGLETIVEE